MRVNHFIFLLIIFSLVFTTNIFSSDLEKNYNSTNVTPFKDLGKNFIDSYTGWNSLYHISAVGITYISVTSGLDAEILKITSGIDPAISSTIGHTGLFLGYIAPIAVPATLYFMSEKNSDLRTASYAVMQSVAIAFAVGSFLKAITGRPGPDPHSLNKDSLSKEFQFGFMQGGLHYGWPSGHLLTNTAMATSLVAFYPEKSWVKNIALGYLAFLTFSMLIHDGGSAHWFSDIVAGGLMGIAFGSTIGKNFRNYRNSPADSVITTFENTNSISFYPQISPDFSGISFNLRF
jgi:membrane-associated phospholipid phosphatase